MVCPDVSIVNGDVNISTDKSLLANRKITATYSCTDGYTLPYIINRTRECVIENYKSVWTGKDKSYEQCEPGSLFIFSAIICPWLDVGLPLQCPQI